MKSLLSIAFLLVLTLEMAGQGSIILPNRVSHRVLSVQFTNSAAFGYADGAFAGADYVCGVYAGEYAFSLRPMFDPETETGLIRPVGVYFTVSGDLPLPVHQYMALQLRFWPSAFDTYEEALMAGVPVGRTPVLPPVVTPLDYIPAVQIVVDVGTIWLSPSRIPEPTIMSVFILGMAALFCKGSRRRG